MKDVILVFVCVITLFVSGCKSFMFSHNENIAGKGKVFKVGAGDYGITYVNGLIGIQAVRENTEMIIESNDGDSFANPASSAKGLCTIRFRTGPQVTGYLKDLADRNADAAVAYVNSMPKLNKAQWDAKQEKPIDTKLSTSKSADGESTTIGYEQIKEAAKSALDKLKGGKASATIKGDGEYTELWKDNTIEAQAALASELLAYADDEAKMPNTGETLRDTLIHYAGRLAQLKAKGTAEATKILLDRATVKDGVLTALMYRLRNDDGTTQDEECPNCFVLEE